MRKRLYSFLRHKKIKNKFLYLVLPFTTIGFLLIIGIIYLSFFVYTRNLIDQQMRYTMDEKLDQLNTYFVNLHSSTDYLLYNSQIQNILRIKQTDLSPDDLSLLKDDVSSAVYNSITRNGLPLKSQYIKAVIIQNGFNESLVTNSSYSPKIEDIISIVKQSTIQRHGKLFVISYGSSDLLFCRAIYGGHIDDWDEYLGICIIEIDTALLNSLIHTTDTESLQYAIMDSDKNIIMNDSHLSSEQCKTISDGHTIYFENGTYETVTLPISDTDLSLIAIVNKGNFFEQYYNILYVIIITAIIAVIFVYASILLASNMIAQQFNVIIQKLKATTSLSQHTTIPVTSEDEIGELITVYNDTMERMKHLNQTITEQQASLQLAELKTLRAQINPHFLYNTLACINSLISLGKSTDASQNIIALSNIMRSNIKGTDFFTIYQEKKYLESYLIIQKTLYNKILFLLEFEDDILDYYIPKLVLQPLIENSIYHGINKQLSSGMIAITGKKRDSVIIFTIRDNGIGMPDEKINLINNMTDNDFNIDCNQQVFGLSNTQLRLKKLYGPQFGLHISKIVPTGTCVTVLIPQCASEKP